MPLVTPRAVVQPEAAMRNDEAQLGAHEGRRVRADRVGDDELRPREPDAVVGELRERERLRGVASRRA